MSRRIRVNRWRSSVTHWVCRKIGHRWGHDNDRKRRPIICLRCGRFW